MWHERIVALWKDGELSLAQDEIAQLKKELPNSEVIEKLTEIEARLAIDSGEYARARELLKPRADLVDLYAKALFALNAYDELIQLPAKNIEALQGLAHLKLKHFEKAKHLLKQAEPSKSVLIGCIDAQLNLGERGEASLLIDQLVALLDPDEKKPYLRLKAHLETDNASRVELLKELASGGFLPASEDLLESLGSIDDPKERLTLIEIIEPNLKEKKSDMLAFWRGQTLAALGQLSLAKDPLLIALNTKGLPKEFEEKTQKALLYIAEKLEDDSLADTIAERGRGSAVHLAALDLKWRIATTRGNHTEALRIAHKSLSERGDLSEGLILVAHSACQSNRNDEVIAAAMRYINEGSPERRADIETPLALAAANLEDRVAAFDALDRWQQAFGKNERMQRLQGEALIALGRKKEAAALLEKLAADSARDALLCICYSPSEPIQASAYGESALRDETAHISSRALHLELFNLYCDIASKKLALPKGHPSFNKPPFERAAHHLFAVFKQAPDQISMRNRIWLCAHFLGDKKTHKEGLALFSHIPKPSPHLIYAAAKATAKAESSKKLLQQALAQSEKSGDLSLTCSTLTALGEVELKVGDKSAARSYFDRAVRMKVQSYETDVAKLALYRLDAESGRIEKARAKSDLKDIQLRKTLEKEPLFLDAALLYVDICSDNCPEKRQRLLEQMQEDFCSGATLFGKHYQKQRAKLPEKDKLLEKYMLLVDLGIESIAAGEDKRRLRATLAKLESSAPSLKATSPELALRCYKLREQIRSVLQ